jgi:hypothetical protein
MEEKRGCKKGVSQEPRRVPFQFGNSLEDTQGIPEDEADTLPGPEGVAEHRKGASPDPGKEQGRPSCSIDATLHGADLQDWIHFPVDTDKFTVTLKVPDTLMKITVPHANTFSPLTTPSVKRRYCGFPEDMICVVDF